MIIRRTYLTVAMLESVSVVSWPIATKSTWAVPPLVTPPDRSGSRHHPKSNATAAAAAWARWPAP